MTVKGSFRSIRGLATKIAVLKTESVAPDRPRLRQICERLAHHRLEASESGDFINVWSLLGLKASELQHASVLAWLFNPQGSHGFGSTLFFRFIESLEFADKALVLRAARRNRYTVQPECYPLNDDVNRVDIEIAHDGFLILIEIKISAVEGPDQIKRYLRLLAAKAAGRASALIYLSLDPRPRLSAKSEVIIPTTWSALADSLSPLVSAENPTFQERLVMQFLNHIGDLK